VLNGVSTRHARSVDELLGIVGIALPSLLSALGSLEARGLVRQSPQGWIGVPERG